MTPEEARRLLDGTTPAEDWWHSVKWGRVRHLEPVGIDAAGELDVTEEDAALILAAPRMAAMIAGMREEWGIVANYLGRHEVEEWGFDTREEAEAEGNTFVATEYRIVRRYVTTNLEATDAVD